jgi:hypothetical protein
MATATEMIGALEDQVLETVRQSQDAVIKAVKTWAEAGKNLVPELPPLPFADQIPATVDLVENAFDFADKLLAAQRDFAAAVLEAARPVIGKADAPKTTNNRSTASKSAS